MHKDDQPAELERFSGAVSSSASLQTVSPFEHRVGWQALDRSGSSRTIELRSEMTLSVSHVRWERRWSLDFAPDPSRLKFIVARGPGPRVTAGTGQTHELLSGSAHVSRIQRSVALRFDFDESTSAHAHEQLCLEVSRERLCELTGTEHLPEVLERTWSSPDDYPFELLSAPAASFRLLDEITHCAARPKARSLHLEAKGLELLAAWVDHLESNDDASRPLTAHDIERLEHARRVLLGRMTTPPRLPELARLSGLNEAKLKAGFRAHFGETVYGYLRQQRLNEAHRLLRQGRYNVTEVALRVGYANPSKFAAAFRALFGLSPSHVR